MMMAILFPGNGKTLETSIGRAMNAITILPALLAKVMICPTIDSQSIKSVGPFEVEGVAVTHPEDISNALSSVLEVSIKVRGPKDNWFARLVNVRKVDGSKIPASQPMASEMAMGDGWNLLPGYSPLRGNSAIDSVLVTGELVHTTVSEETVTFPKIRLVTPSRIGRTPGPSMRNWFLPDHVPYEAVTPLGLKLRRAPLKGYGYSGRGYNDWALIPLEVDLKTLNKGLENELKAGPKRYVDRVTASAVFADRLGMPQTIYDSGIKEFESMISLMDRDFSEEPVLKLMIDRYISDKKLQFSMVIPVQKDRVMVSWKGSKYPEAIWPK